MYFLDNWHKFALTLILLFGFHLGYSAYLVERTESKTSVAVQKMNEDISVGADVENVYSGNAYPIGLFIVCILVFLIFIGDLRKMFKQFTCVAMCLFLVGSSVGCYRPFEPIKLVVVGTQEEAFLIPYVGNGKEQASTNNEEYLTKNLVFTKQVKIPQQWVPHGYEWTGANGSWQDAAVLLKVDKSPVTRHWTADTTSGTSNKNEAIWVMTSDGVEWSTGWTITARIATREDAVKFLHNYPNGSLITVCDTEIHSKLQTEFGIEVTDQPMKKLREAATPHITATVKRVTEFFKERGIQITNLGISGGFVYKDHSVNDMLVKVFNAEQEKSISAAQNAAQIELNLKELSIKKTEAEGLLALAEGNAKKIEIDALAGLAKAKAEAEGNKLLAESLTPELVRVKLYEKWDGALPKFSGGITPLMNIDNIVKEEK